MISAKMKSPIWKYYSIYETDNKLAVCLLCNRKISRGGEGKKAGTTSLKNHLRNKHAEEYSILDYTVTGEKGSNLNNAPISNSRAKVQSTMMSLKPANLTAVTTKSACNENDSKAKSFHYLIAEMIALDNESYSIAERIGFKRLLKKALPYYKIPSPSYIASEIIPDIYNRIRLKIKAKISKESAISITSDIYTCQHKNKPFLVFMVHWLCTEFDFHHFILNVKSFEKTFSAENIVEELNAIMDLWDISQSKVNLLIHNSECHKEKQSRYLGYDTGLCFKRILQNIIDESLKCQDEVLEMISTGREIVDHINNIVDNVVDKSLEHPVKAIDLMSIAKEIVENFNEHIAQDQSTALLNLPRCQIDQDNSTQNSTYNLLEYLLTYKEYISLYTAKYKVLTNLTPSQWNLLEQCINLLRPFEDINKITSSGLSPISEIIPHVVTLIKYLGKDETTVRTPDLIAIQSQLKAELEIHFNFERNDYEKYFLATFLDPRFKTSFFDSDQSERTIRKVILEGFKISSDEWTEEDCPPPNKRQFTNEDINGFEGSCTFWRCFDEIANSSTVVAEKRSVANEIDYYLKTIHLGRKANPYKWWLENTAQYPILSKLARIYLSAPCNSSNNKSLFLKTDFACEQKCNLLHESNAEELVFIHHNLPLMDFNY